MEASSQSLHEPQNIGFRNHCLSANLLEHFAGGDMCKYVLSLCGPCWTKVCHSFLPIESWLLRWQSDPFASQWEFIFCQWIMKNKLVIIVVKSLRALEPILARLKCKSQDIFWWRRSGRSAVSPVCTPRHCHAASSLPIVHTSTQSSYFC